METPDRVQMPRSRIQHIIEPSPRIDAITINNKLNNAISQNDQYFGLEYN